MHLQDLKRDPGSSVSIVTRLRTKRPWFVFR